MNALPYAAGGGTLDGGNVWRGRRLEEERRELLADQGNKLGEEITEDGQIGAPENVASRERERERRTRGGHAARMRTVCGLAAGPERREDQRRRRP